VAELAAVLPFLVYSGLATTDFARAFQHLTVVTDCARAGARYASDPGSASYPSISDAALAGGGSLSPTPSVTTANGTDATSGLDYVDVTVTHTFSTLARYPGIPSSLTLRRTVRMPKHP
jgi:hypothetical protein